MSAADHSEDMPPTASRPLWSEGLLLTPQHLEQQDHYHEGRVDQLLRALHPAPWGVVSLRLDEAALARGEVVIPELVAILPDGAPIAWGPAGPQAAPSRGLAGPELAGRGEILVRVAVAELRRGAPNLSVEGGARRRFRVRALAAHDLAAALPAATVDVVDLDPRIVFADEPVEGTRSLAIAELVRRPDGSFALADDFIPPSLTLTATTALPRALQRIAAAALRRRRRLLDGCGRRGDRIEYRADDLDRHLMIHALGRLIPRLRHLLDGPPTPPMVAHQLLVELVGELSSYTGDLDPAALPAYDHGDLRASFRPLFGHAERLLGIALESAVITVPLRARGDGIFTATGLDAAIEAATPVYLGIAGEHRLGRGEALAELIKIGAERRIDALVRGKSRGAPTRALRRVPPALIGRPGETLLAIDAADPHWREVLRERDLAIHVSPPVDPGGLTLRLLALPPRNENRDGLAPQRCITGA